VLFHLSFINSISRWGSLQRSPRPPSWILEGLLLRGKGKGRDPKGEEGRGKEGREKGEKRDGEWRDWEGREQGRPQAKAWSPERYVIALTAHIACHILITDDK